MLDSPSYYILENQLVSNISLEKVRGWALRIDPQKLPAGIYLSIYPAYWYRKGEVVVDFETDEEVIMREENLEGRLVDALTDLIEETFPEAEVENEAD